MNYNLFKKQFLDCIGLLSWDTMDKQVKQDFKNNTCRVLGKGKDKTYLLTDLSNYCFELSDLFQKINMRQKSISNKDLKNMHVYLSTTSNAKTFGRHNDSVDVLLVQSVGKMSYKFDSGETIILAPGDGIFIPKHMYHDPIPIEPRITLSLSWE